MKKFLIVLIIAISFNAGNTIKAQVYTGISFNTFYNELSPYGRWIDYPTYGQIWIASQQGFEPYYNNGHWIYTNFGWTWISDYSWGWAPFHYGRWTYIPAFGWAWVPGYEWAPAWVGWCQNDGYYGWAPLSPGMGFNYSFGSIPLQRWRFVRHQYINSPEVYNHFINPVNNVQVYNNVSIINNTQVINNTQYLAGPLREDVVRMTKKNIETIPVTFSQTPEKTGIEKNVVKIYRPDIIKSPITPNNNPGATQREDMVPPRAIQNGVNNKLPVKVEQQQQPVLPNKQNTMQDNKRMQVDKDEQQQKNEKQLAIEQQNIQQQNDGRQQQMQQQRQEQKMLEKQNQQNTQRQHDLRQQQIRTTEIPQKNMQQPAPQIRRPEKKEKNDSRF
jgi:hypothetical protein